MASRVRPTEVNREEALNVILAQMLTNRGLNSKPERRGRRGAPDVQVTLRSFRILLECKWEGSETSLETQLQERRAAFPEALAVLGVLYPDRLRYAEDPQAALESADDLQWWQAKLPSLLDLAKDLPAEQRRASSGSVDDLADHLRILPLDLQGVDQVEAAAGSVAYALDQAAYQLNLHERIASRVAEIIADTDQEKNRAAALRIGCLVLFNALAFQDRLSNDNDDVPTVREASNRGIPSLRDAWHSICVNIDYESVFELAIVILDVLLDGPADVRTPVIAPLIKAVDETRKVEGHDLSGRLFHTLLTDAKFTGAYYTSVPAATLLTRLVFHNWPEGVDWRNHEFPGSLNVADLACGTGTLLMAVAAEAERRHKAAGGKREAELHKAMVEQALHGYDVQLSAVHFAATSLAMLNPHIEFDRMNLSVMSLGEVGNQILLGSLEFLNSDEVLVQYELSPQDADDGSGDKRRSRRSTSRGTAVNNKVKLPKLDLAIMNPPFTRSVGGNLLFGSKSATERRKLQDELSRRLKSRQASATAGLGPAFVAAVSERMLHGEGRLALVLPLTVCTGPSWAQTRALIEQDFILEMVIASHDPQRWNFSDSTKLSEALLIATRRPRVSISALNRTSFINLWRNPAGVADALRTAQAITITTPAELEGTGTALLDVDSNHVGELVSIHEANLDRKQWIGVQFARADVLRSAVHLLENGEIWLPGGDSTASVPLCSLGEFGEIGPDVRDMRDGFEPTDAITAYPMVEGHDTKKRKHLIVEPDKYLAPLTQPRRGRRLKPISLLWPKAGRLLIAERLRLNTARVVSMSCDRPVLSNVWWPIKTDNHTWDKTLTVYLNSSIGVLALLATRNTTEGNWVKLKKADLKELPVLDLRCLSASQLQALSRLFDNLATAEFERLPRMVHCPARQALDDGIAQILDLPDLSTLRHLLASEPVISNRRL